VIEVSLTADGDSPSGLQWTLNYPTDDFASVHVVTGPTAVNAGKYVTCVNAAGSVSCLILGMNDNPIANGTVATAMLQVSPGAPDSVVQLQVSDAVAASPDGTSIPISGGSSRIEIGHSRHRVRMDAGNTGSPPGMTGGFGSGAGDQLADVVPYGVAARTDGPEPAVYARDSS